MGLIYRRCPLCDSDSYNDKIYKKIMYTREYKTSGPIVAKCNICGMIYLNPIEDKESYRKFYDNDEQRNFVLNIMGNYEARIMTQAMYRYNLLKSEINHNYDVLDVGCGYSYFLKMIEKCAHKVFGIEVSKMRAKAAKERGIDVTHGDIFNWDIGKKIDVITMFHVLEHIVNPNEFMLRLREIIKEDGKLIIEIPNHDDILLKNRSYRKFYYQNAHCSYFTIDTLEQLLNKFGFAIEKQIPLQRYSLSNHLHWYFKKCPGEFNWAAPLNSMYSWIIKHTKKYDTLLIIAKKVNLQIRKNI